jgi:hypothetical protein
MEELIYEDDLNTFLSDNNKPTLISILYFSSKFLGKLKLTQRKRKRDGVKNRKKKLRKMVVVTRFIGGLIMAHKRSHNQHVHNKSLRHGRERLFHEQLLQAEREYDNTKRTHMINQILYLHPDYESLSNEYLDTISDKPPPNDILDELSPYERLIKCIRIWARSILLADFNKAFVKVYYDVCSLGL